MVPNRGEPLFYSAFCPDWAWFRSFCDKAKIKPFDERILPCPREHSSYNDSLHLPAYASTARTFAGKQLKGVSDEHCLRLSTQEHVGEALDSPFFLSLQTPLPPATIEDALFIRDSPQQAVVAFWNDQLAAADRLIEDAAPLEQSWGLLIPDDIAPAAGRVRLAALMSLALQCGLGGSLWLQQFLVGFDLIGQISQRFSYPPGAKAFNKTPLGPAKVMSSAAPPPPPPPAFRRGIANQGVRTLRFYGTKLWANKKRAGYQPTSRCLRGKSPLY